MPGQHSHCSYLAFSSLHYPPSSSGVTLHVLKWYVSAHYCAYLHSSTRPYPLPYYHTCSKTPFPAQSVLFRPRRLYKHGPRVLLSFLSTVHAAQALSPVPTDISSFLQYRRRMRSPRARTRSSITVFLRTRSGSGAFHRVRLTSRPTGIMAVLSPHSRPSGSFENSDFASSAFFVTTGRISRIMLR